METTYDYVGDDVLRIRFVVILILSVYLNWSMLCTIWLPFQRIGRHQRYGRPTVQPFAS